MEPEANGPELRSRAVDRRETTLTWPGCSLREFLIAFFVISHFALGLLSILPQRSKIWGLPAFRAVGIFYRNNRLDQSWTMFSPPPTMSESLQYSVKLPGGWTPLIPLSSFALDEVKHRLVEPRGMFRLVSFLRVTAADKIPGGLSETSSRALYYQQLSYYFCRGDGNIPDIVAIRFYLVGRGVPDFFDTDKYGQPLPDSSEFDYQIPLYEQICSPR
jgi:hypothetical protein